MYSFHFRIMNPHGCVCAFYLLVTKTFIFPTSFMMIATPFHIIPFIYSFPLLASFFYYSLGLVSMLPQHDHSCVVELQYHNRAHRNTRLCTSNIFNMLLYIPCLRFLLVSDYRSSSPPSPPLPRPLLSTPFPLRLLGPVPPVSTIYYKTMLQASAPSSLRGSESAALRCTMRPYYASSGNILLYPQPLIPPSLSPAVGTSSSHPPINLAASL